MAADATYLLQLIKTGVQLGQGAGVRKIVSRLTPIADAQDPLLNEKLSALSPGAEQVLIAQLADLLLSVP